MKARVKVSEYVAWRHRRGFPVLSTAVADVVEVINAERCRGIVGGEQAEEQYMETLQDGHLFLCIPKMFLEVIDEATE